MSNLSDIIDPVVANAIQTATTRIDVSKFTRPEDTDDYRFVITLENRAKKSMMNLLKAVLQLTPGEDVIIYDIQKQYGFIFAFIIRGLIEKIYTRGATKALNFDNIQIPYFTTTKDITIIQRWTQESLGKFWNRFEQYLNNDKITIAFVFETVLAEITTFVLMESQKEKSKQLIQVMSIGQDGQDSSIQVAQAAKAYPDYNPNFPMILFLMNLKGVSESRELSDYENLDPFGNIEDLSELQDRYYYVWLTARDDRVCKRYCRPLDGVAWSFEDIGLIPQPDMLTHPRCRCQIYRVRI